MMANQEQLVAAIAKEVLARWQRRIVIGGGAMRIL
jgi:hypothetical protein